MDAAKCIACIPPGAQFQVLVSLLCQIANNPGGGGGVTQLIAGTNITLNPAGGTGAVTINASGGGVTNFTSAPATVNVVNITTQNHGLANTPTFYHGVMRCIANDAASALVAGDEVGCEFFFDTFNACPLFNIGVNATQVFARSSIAVAGNEAGVVLVAKGGGVKVHITSGNNFRLVIYAQQ